MGFNTKLWGLTCLFMVLCISISFGALTDDLTAYYSFEETSLPLDKTGNHNNATSNVGWTCGVTGKIGNACWNDTDGANAYIEIPNSALPKGTMERTFNFWKKDASLTYNGAAHHGYISYGSNANLQYVLIGGGYTGAHQYLNDGNSQLTIGTDKSTNWNMITVTYNGTCLTWYQNTTRINALCTAINTGTTSALRIGAAASGFTAGDTTNDFYIDELGLWNRTITAAEITQLYNNGDGYYPLLTNPITINSINITPVNANEFTDLTVTLNVTGGVNATLNCSDEGGVIYSLYYPSIYYNTTTISETLTKAKYNVTCNLTVLNGTWSSSKLSNKVYINYTIPTINKLNITADYTTLADTTDLAYWDAQNLTCQANISGSDNLSYSWYRNNNFLNTKMNTDFYCYQETANISTACGGLNTGKYSIEANYFYINYTKPNKSTSYSLWRTKIDNFGDLNITIPLDCWNFNDSIINFRIYSLSLPPSANVNTTYGQCYNGTWKTITQIEKSTSSVGSCGGMGDYSSVLLDGDWTTYTGYATEWEPEDIIPGSPCINIGFIYEEAMYWVIQNTTIINSSYYSINDNISCRVTAYNGTFNATSSRNITIRPPQVTYVNIVNTSTIFKQNMSCNYSITHPDNYSVDWLFDSVMTKNDSDIFSIGDYYDLLFGKNVSCRLNSTVLSQNYTAYNSSINSFIVGQRINFSANLATTNAAVQNFNITYSQGTFNATAYNITIYNWNVTEEYTFQSPDYQMMMINLTTNTALQYYLFHPYKARTINISFYDAKTFALLNDRNITLEIFSSTNDSYYNYSTDTGYVFAELISPLTYQFKSVAPGYQTNYLYYTVLPESYNNKKIYMINSSVKVTYTVIDDSTQVKEGITIKIGKYDPVLSAWVYIQECTTNDVGTCSFYVNEPDTYRYYLFDAGGNLVYFVSNELVDYTTRIFIIPTTSTTFPIFDKCQYVKNHLYYPEPVYTNNTNAFNFTISMSWTDASISKVCMKLYIQNSTLSGLFDECIFYSSQAQIYKNNVLLQNKSYTLEWYAITDGEYCLVNRLSIDLKNKEAGSSDLFWYFITAVLLIFGTSVGVMLRSPELTMLLDLAILTGCNIMFSLSISYAAIFGLWIIAGIIYWKRNN